MAAFNFVQTLQPKTLGLVALVFFVAALITQVKSHYQGRMYTD